MFFPLIILSLFTLSKSECFGFDPINNECKECPINEYLAWGLMNKQKLNRNLDCKKKLPADVLYNKSFYVRDNSCSDLNHPSLCEGTRENPFDNFMQAIMQIHINDLAGKYTEQNIHIFFLGKNHYLKYQDLNYSEMRIFRMLNASIEMRPLFCEEDNYPGCILKSENELIDFHIKTDQFQFEIYRTLKISNLRIIGNDIVLKESNSLFCYNQNTVCCTSENFPYYEECQIHNRFFYVPEMSKMGKFNGLFILRNFLEDNNQYYQVKPCLNLSDVHFLNLHSFEQDDNWFSLICINDLNYKVYLNNVYFLNNTLPFGYLYQIPMIYDPYYNFLSQNEISKFLLFALLYENEIHFTNVIINHFNSINLSIILMSSHPYFSLINIAYVMNLNTKFYVESLMVKYLNWQAYPLMNSVFYIDFIQDLSESEIFYIFFHDLVFESNKNFGFIIVRNTIVKADNFLFYYFTNTDISTINLDLLSKLHFFNGLIGECSFSVSGLFLNSIQSFLHFEKTLFENSFGKFAFLFRSSLQLSNCYLDNFIINEKSYLIELLDSNLTLFNTNFTNGISNSTSGAIFRSYSLDPFIFISYKKGYCFNVTAYVFFMFESFEMFSIVELQDLEFFGMNGVWNDRFYYYFLIDCYSGFMDKIILQNIFIHDSQTLQPLLISAEVNNVSIVNLKIINLKLFCYYLISADPEFYRYNSSINIQNITLKNIIDGRSISLFYIDSFENVVLKDGFIVNITSIIGIVQLKISSDLFDFSNNYSINITNINFFQNSISCANNVFYFIYNTNVNFSNSKIISEFSGEIGKFQAFGVSIFSTMTFTNNIVSGMSSFIKLTTINDKLGIVSFCGKEEDDFYFDSIILNFLNNTIASSNSRLFGSVGILEVTNVYAFNNSFFDNKGNYGAGFYLYGVEQSFFQNNYCHDNTANEGGFIYAIKIYNTIILSDTILFNISAFVDGGSFFIKESNNMYIENMIIKNSSSQSSAGSFFIYLVQNLKILNIKIENSYSEKGGSFFIQDSNVLIFQSLFKNGHAFQNGGSIYLLGKASLFIDHSEFSDIYSEGDGAIIASSNINNMMIQFTIFRNALVVKGKGIIFLEGYADFDVTKEIILGVFMFENVIFSNNFANFGCNLFFSSNNLLIMKNITSVENFGSLFSIESDQFQFFYIDGIIIHLNNNISDISLGNFIINPLIIFFNILIKMSNLFLNQNYVGSSFFKITRTKFFLFNSLVKDFLIEEKLKLFGYQNIIFNAIGSSIYSEKNVFCSYQSIFELMIYEMDLSFLFSSGDNFYNLSSNAFSFFIFKNCQLILNEAFLNNLNISEVVIFVQTSNLIINNSKFIDNRNSLSDKLSLDEKFSEILFDCSKSISFYLLINNSVFKTFSANAIYVLQTVNFSLTNCFFLSNSVSEERKINRALYMIDINTTFIFNTTFFSYFSPQGSSIICINKRNSVLFTILQIVSSNFNNNTAFSAGSIYIIGAIQLIIESSIFQGNKAIKTLKNYKIAPEESGKAGAILIDCEYFSLCEVHIVNSKFLYNFAEDVGPTVLCKTDRNAEIRDNIFLDNYDNFNFSNQISAFPLKAFLLNSNFRITTSSSNLISNKELTLLKILKFGITNLTIVSGKEFNFSLLLTDFFDQTLIKEAKALGTLKCEYESQSDHTSSVKSILIDRGLSQSMEGEILFRNVKIIAVPNNNLTCRIYITYSDSLIFHSSIISNSQKIRSFFISFVIFVRPCIVGEIYLDDQTCFECKMGSYSIIDPMQKNSPKQCDKCPENTFCKGGKYISPFKNYWRNSLNSTLIIKCLTPNSCLGVGENFMQAIKKNFDLMSEDEIIQGVCGPNYFGNFCFQCKKGFARFKTNAECEACENLYIIYMKMALSSIFIIIYISFQARVFSKIEHKDPHLAVLMKLLLNHFQTVSLINLVDLGWTAEFDFYFSFQDYLSFLSQDFFVIDCLIQNIEENNLIQKIIFTTLLPIISAVTMIIIWFFVFSFLMIRHKLTLDGKLYKFMIEKMRITILILVFILYPEVLRKSFSLLNCIELDNFTKTMVLALSPNVLCWTEQHKFWVLTVSLPGLIVWGIFSPLILLFIMKKNHSWIKEMIQERQKKYMDEFINMNLKNQINKKYNQKISVLMEKQIANKLFPKGLPKKSILIYTIKKTHFIRTIEFFIKKREEIICEAAKNKTKPTVTKSNLHFLNPDIMDRDFTSTDQFLKIKNNCFVSDPKTLYRMIDLDWEVNRITEEDLRQNLVHIMEEVEDLSPKLIMMKHITRDASSYNKKDEIINIPFSTQLVITNLGFIYRGYRKDYYFWEIVMFSRKFILICIGVFTEMFPNQTKPTMLLIILMSYISLQITYKPYQFTYLNALENLSLTSSFVTALIGVILFSDYMKKLAAFYLAIVFLVNLIFLTFWIRYLIKYGKVKEKLKTMKSEVKIRISKYSLFCCFYCWRKKIDKSREKVAKKIFV